VQACEVVDKCLQELLDAVDAANGRWLVTADHGNADDMVQRTKKGEPIKEEGKPVPLTSHTLAPVGVAIGGKGLPESVEVRRASHLPRRIAACMYVGCATCTCTSTVLMQLHMLWPMVWASVLQRAHSRCRLAASPLCCESGQAAPLQLR
jgi:hypothetical protein